jgi:outer membrane protein OmpA-like peptidoglycan-associated protein
MIPELLFAAAIASVPNDPGICDTGSFEFRFASGSARLSPESRRVLDGVATIVKARPDKGRKAEFVIIAGADTVGTSTANAVLAQSRGLAISRYLQSKGFSDDHFPLIKFYAGSWLKVETGFDVPHPANRRAVLTLNPSCPKSDPLTQ